MHNQKPDSVNYLTISGKAVLSLVSSGLTTKEIAEVLRVSYHRVESYRKNLLRKCCAKNFAELIQKTIRVLHPDIAD